MASRARWLEVTTVMLLSSCTAETPTPSTQVEVRPVIGAELLEAQSQTRARAKSLGLADADSAAFDDVVNFVCTRLLAAPEAKVGAPGRAEFAVELGTHGCRDHSAWLTSLRATAAEQGLADADDATLGEARSFVCRRIKESVAAAGDDAAKAVLETEATVYDCQP